MRLLGRPRPLWGLAALVVIGLTGAVLTTRHRSGPAPAIPDAITTPPTVAAAGTHLGSYEGGLYKIEVPETWNGGLVVFAHGYRGEGGRPYVTDPPLGFYLTERGYAWAASSYRGNGYRPDWGIEDSLALLRMFARRHGPPRWTVIYGQSMGGHIVVGSLELHPGVYQGGLAECGIVNGVGIADYLYAYTAAAEYISGIRFREVPDPETFHRLVSHDWLSVMGWPAAYTEKGRQFDSVVKYLLGGDWPYRTEGLTGRYLVNLGDFGARLSPELMPYSRPVARAVDTRHLRYQIDESLGLSEAELNAGVTRFTPARGSRSPETDPVFAELSGRLTAPLLTIHETGDAWVPMSLEQDYRRKAIAAGADHLLVQRAIRRPGHCGFSSEERIRAFEDLVAWIERGVMPEGDDLLNPDMATVGLRWTTPLRDDDPAQR